LFPYPTDPPVLLLIGKSALFRAEQRKDAEEAWKTYLFLRGRLSRPPRPEVIAPIVGFVWRAYRAAVKSGASEGEVYRLLLSFKEVLPLSVKPVEGEESLFVGRDEYDELRMQLLRTSAVLALVGERGVGKSSILRRLASDLSKLGWICVTIEVPMPYDPRDLLSLMLQRLTRAILDIPSDVLDDDDPLKKRAREVLEDITYEKYQAVEEEGGVSAHLSLFSLSRGWRLKESRRKYRTSLPGLVSEIKTLLRMCHKKLAERAGPFGIVIAIDEVDKLEALEDWRRELHKLLGIIRGISHISGTYVIFSALPGQLGPPSPAAGEDLEARGAGGGGRRGNPEYSTIDSYVALRPMDEARIRRLVMRRLNVSGLREIFDPEAVELIVKLSGGVPREAVRLLAESFYHGLRLGEDTITTETVKDAASRLGILA